MSGFRDRRDAGRQLAALLEQFRADNPVVLALPRGGVPVAFEVAESLGAPLDILLVRKIGAPDQKEFGLGAVAEGPEPVILLDESLVRMVAPPAGYLEAETKRELEEMARRRARYAGSRQPVAIAGRTVIVIDDGIATGGTARAALRALRQLRAGKVVLAVPVAAPESLESLRPEADKIICLLEPALMRAVGNYYGDFGPTSDQEVKDLLELAQRRQPDRPATTGS